MVSLRVELGHVIFYISEEKDVDLLDLLPFGASEYLECFSWLSEVIMQSTLWRKQ